MEIRFNQLHWESVEVLRLTGQFLLGIADLKEKGLTRMAASVCPEIPIPPIELNENENKYDLEEVQEIAQTFAEENIAKVKKGRPKNKSKKDEIPAMDDVPQIPKPPISDLNMFPALITKITNATTGGKLTLVQVLETVKSLGISDIPSIPHHPELIAPLSTLIDELLKKQG